MKLINSPIRKRFNPLNISGTVRVLTPGSPLIQYYDSLTGVISPDRNGDEGTPLCLLPDISMKTTDSSLSKDYTNADIVTGDSSHPFVWYANGKDIRTVLTSGYDFDIVTSGYDATLGTDITGELVFRRNLAKGEEMQLYYECYILDTRTSTFVHVVSDPVTLGCSERGLDEYTLVVSGAPAFTYNPVNDTRAEYEYCTANGLTPVVSETEADDVSYLHTWELRLRQADTDVTNYTVKVYDKTDTTTELAADPADGIIAITQEKLVIDTRLRESRQYEIAAFLADSTGSLVEVDRVTVGYSTYYPALDAVAINGSDYLPGSTMRTNQVIVATQSQRKRSSTSPTAGQLRWPDRLLDFVWYGQNTLSTSLIKLGEGSRLTYSLSLLTLGDNDEGDSANNVASCNFLESCDADWKGTLSVGTDEESSVLTDTDGNVLAFNS